VPKRDAHPLSGQVAGPWCGAVVRKRPGIDDFPGRLPRGRRQPSYLAQMCVVAAQLARQKCVPGAMQMTESLAWPGEKRWVS